MVSDNHQVRIRGAGARLAQHIDAAISRGVRPPSEWVAKGPTGTGKSFGVVAAVIRVARKYPKVPGRVLIIRLTRNSITTSTCVTIRKIMHPSDPMVDDNRADENRTHYKVGAWVFQLGGLDNIDNLLSTEWDFIILDECRQASLNQWQQLASRGMRNYALYLYDANGHKCAPGQGVSPIPFGMCIGLTNPWQPKTWFNLRARLGLLELVLTTRQENPAYYDDAGNILPMGAAYEQTMQETLTPGTPMYRRMWKGEDAGAEGMILEEWIGDLEPEDDKLISNMVRVPRDIAGFVARETLIALGITEFYCGVDFGDTDPGCLLLAGYTKKRKLIVLAEVYQRRQGIDWWAAWVKRLHALYPIRLGFCDHNRPDWVRAFNDAVGAQQEGPGQVFVLADKGWDRGVQILRKRVANKTLLVDVDALAHPPQQELVDASHPTCFADEVPGWIYWRDPKDGEQRVPSAPTQEKEDPKCANHGCSAARYLTVGVDYFEPANRLAEPPNHAYRKRFLAIQRVLGNKYDSVDEIEDFGDEIDNESVDTLRRAVWGGEEE